MPSEVRVGCRLIVATVSLAFVAGSIPAYPAYPEKPVHIVVGFPPGGPADTVARLLGQRWSEVLGKPVVVDNATGAAGNIATERVAAAAADGYTVGLMTEAQMVINPVLYKPAYDPERAFTPVTQVTVSPYMLVVANALPAKSIRDLVSLAQAQAGLLTFASAGTGSTPHMAGELFKSATKVDIRHVPYRGIAPAIPDVVSGRVQIMFSPVMAILPLAREGKVRALAVTSLTRSAAAPDVPTVAESGYPGFEVTGWLALVGPAGMPPDIAWRLHVETVKALDVPHTRNKLASLGLDPIGSAPDVLAALIRSGLPKWRAVIAEAGITAD